VNLKIFGLALASTAAMLAQAPATKVGVINIQQTILSTKDGQKATQNLQAKFDPRRKDIERKQQEIQQMQDSFRKTQNTASEDQRTKLARDIDQKQMALKRDMEDAQGDFEQEQSRAYNELGGRLLQVIDKYARDNSYTLILDVSSPQTPVLYMANGTDITAEIVKLYDANAPAAAPATGAPGAGAPAGGLPGSAAPKPTTIAPPKLPLPSPSKPATAKP
jgi:outer membrane protein